MASSPEKTAEAHREAAAPTLTPSPPCRDNDEDGCGCRTPTSEESKLPSVPALECPPAPRKRPWRAAACGRWRRRRRLWRLPDRDPVPEIVSVGAEELEELFRLRDDEAAPAAATPGGLHASKKPRCNDSDSK